MGRIYDEKTILPKEVVREVVISVPQAKIVSCLHYEVRV
jgi:hypothetical protein